MVTEKGWERKRSWNISRRRCFLPMDSEIHPKKSASAIDVQKEIRTRYFQRAQITKQFTRTSNLWRKVGHKTDNWYEITLICGSVFAKIRRWISPWSTLFQLIATHPIASLILSSHLCVGFTSGLKEFCLIMFVADPNGRAV
jgi:hypothetical protein